MSETNKMTPGPWGIQQYRNHVGFSVWAGNRGCIAERWYDNEQSPPYGDEILANARAIASLPELIAALQRLLRADERPPSHAQVHEAIEAMASARAALEKAGVC